MGKFVKLMKRVSDVGFINVIEGWGIEIYTFDNSEFGLFPFDVLGVKVLILFDGFPSLAVLAVKNVLEKPSLKGLNLGL